MTMCSTRPSDGLSVLIIGCGQIAGGYDEGKEDAVIRTHAKAFQRHGGFRLAACVDPDIERRLAFQTRWGVERTHADLAELDGQAFDVVVLCSPPEVHAPQLERLLTMEVGVVFCEKPLTANLTASRRLVRAFADQCRMLGVNYLRRWDPSMGVLRERIRAGELGALLSASLTYTKGVFANGSHGVDLLHFLLDGRLSPLAVHRVVEDYLPDDPTLDAALAAPNGAIVHLRAGDRRAYTVFELELAFENAAISLGDSGFRLLERKVEDDARFDGYRKLGDGEWRPTGLGSAMLLAASDLHRAVTSGADLPSTGETALMAQEVCAELVALAAGRR